MGKHEYYELDQINDVDDSVIADFSRIIIVVSLSYKIKSASGVR